MVEVVSMGGECLQYKCSSDVEVNVRWDSWRRFRDTKVVVYGWICRESFVG